MKRRTFLAAGGAAAIGNALTACGGSHNPPPSPPPPEPTQEGTVTGWNNQALEAVRTTRMAPPMAARAVAIVHSAMYEAWAAYDNAALGQYLGAQLRRPAVERTAANKARAMSFAAYAALLDQFPGQQAAFTAYLITLGSRPIDAYNNSATAPRLGTIAAQAVLDKRRDDGANQAGTMAPGGAPFADYSGYLARNPPLLVIQPTPRSGIVFPDRWQPLSFNDAAGVRRTQSFLTPFWGTLQPFALTSGSQFRPPPPAAFGTQEFVDQATEIVQIQATLTERQKVIGDFWAGGASAELPGSYWCRFAQLISARKGYTDDDDVKLFFALTNAVFDASIAAWDAKRAYDSARPITAIRYLFNGRIVQSFGPEGPAGGLRPVPGEAWMPFQLPSAPTPAFPDHASGHSTFSAASADVLRRFTGSDLFRHAVTIQARSLLIDPGLPTAPVTLAWETFTDAVIEASASRGYTGIHFERASDDGRSLGNQVGATAFARARALWSGNA
ncbi:vanadium-dependent haloperoxidase [Massilia violaceinigra]|uniref:Vanadium-dependent haloperoxidase n=1 Tax=Massilia violaceinigra TaxID=2045208 RepID=A0ABY4A879_9BURK|nr:vanadium-dependent haloperoxidase [Massilia violaceinigra]UOD30204.1 vanadium-dependent haloperoxidase [Massilia violaceinigra]